MPETESAQRVKQFVADEPPGEKAAVRFGARLGANITNTNFNQGFPKPVVSVETTWKAGVMAGFFWQIPLRKNLFLQQEYLFSQMGGAEKSTGTTYQLRYLSLPLLLQYKPLSKLAFVVGPQFDLLLQAKERTNGTTTTITHDTEERSFGATAGLEFYITNGFSLQARYMQGLNHIGIGQRSDVQEFKHQMVQVATAIRF
ncbi:outer membrane beta-barrel protein [Hymenobacter sp. GOD-10R]|uniref:outer membrane beta-barrel protein n=1 Tax=Hymenobacter sp. GOD-10R TaxID=3093922 RepID=UPI002D794BAB|nr:outer membrane beta-barrel protein [Hymenobacter sp. GOD-10R]WRQ27959.1 outer membrane beta-barrel protein [Hymenobacter sp. GOD-10R]